MYELNDTLQDMGIVNAFDKEKADLSKFVTSTDSDFNAFISKVLHKTHIEVNEQGTKASAVTAVMVDKCDSVEDAPLYNVTLDRPFLFAIYDYQEEIPIFIGTVMN